MACGQKLDAIHLRHPLIHQQKGDGIVALLQFGERFKSGLPGIRSQDAILLGIPAPQIPLDRAENFRIVIHSENRGFRHE